MAEVLFKFKNKKNFSNRLTDISEILKSLNDHVLVLFSKKGFFYNKYSADNYSNLFLFTENKFLSKLVKLKDNVDSVFVKFPKKNLDKFLFMNIKKNIKKIFKNSDTALVINVSFPRKNSRANTIIFVSKKDFL